MRKTLSLKSHHQQSADHRTPDHRQWHQRECHGTHVGSGGRYWQTLRNEWLCTNDLVKSDIPVCSGKTVVEVDTHKVLLGLHEAPYLKDNEARAPLYRSSTRVHGTCVDDTLRRHGGTQRIAGEDDIGTSYNFELDVTDRLLTLQTRYPTPDELESLPTVWLTSAEPWDPTSLEAPDKLGPAFHGWNLRMI